MQCVWESGPWTMDVKRLAKPDYVGARAEFGASEHPWRTTGLPVPKKRTKLKLK